MGPQNLSGCTGMRMLYRQPGSGILGVQGEGCLPLVFTPCNGTEVLSAEAEWDGWGIGGCCVP